MAGQPRTKLFYKIGEVSRLAGVEPYILRYWETEFPTLSPRKNNGGQRVYRHKDLETVLLIKRMLHEEGYTIAGARKRLSGGGPEDEPEPQFPQGENKELADVLGRFRDEIKGILDLIR